MDDDDNESITSVSSFQSTTSERTRSNLLSARIKVEKLAKKCRECRILHNKITTERDITDLKSSLFEHLTTIHGIRFGSPKKSVKRSADDELDKQLDNKRSNAKIISASEMPPPKIGLTLSKPVGSDRANMPPPPPPPASPPNPAHVIDLETLLNTSMDNTPFISPTKVVKLKHLFQQTTPETQTRNKYTPLQNEEPVETENNKQDNQMQHNVEVEIKNKTAQTIRQKDTNKPSNPPPIIIKGKLTSHKAFMSEIKKVTRSAVTMKYAKNSVIVYTETIPDYNTIKRLLNNEDTEYHTYSLNDEKTHAFVLRGLDGDIEENDIKHELKDEYNINATQVYKMKNTFRPLYLVVTDAIHTVAKLNRTVKVLQNVKVTWENRKNQKPITQCQRCQMWGHSKINCSRKYKCSRCSQEHEITACPNNEQPPKCANCEGPHRSISTSCPVYKYKLTQLPTMSTSKQHYFPAPPPTNPAWRQTSHAMPQRKQMTYPTDDETDYEDSDAYPAVPQTRPRRNEKQTRTHENYELLYNKNFPNTLGANRSRKEVQNDENVDVGGKFQTLNNKFQELNELINLDDMIAAVSHYVDMLRACKDKVSRFHASSTFFSKEIQKYNI